MVTDNKDYVDTSEVGQSYVGVHLDLSDSNGDSNSIGWFSEDSIQYILYSLYKSIGFAPFYDVLVHDQKTANSFTTIYSFSAFLKSRYPAHAATLNALLAAKNITTTAIDQWDSTKTEFTTGGVTGSLPVYAFLPIATPVSLNVINSDIHTYNKLLHRRFFAFTVPTTGSRTIIITRSASIASSPYVDLYFNGVLIRTSPLYSSGTSLLSFPLGTLSAGTYYGEIYDDSVSAPVSFTLTLTY